MIFHRPGDVAAKLRPAFWRFEAHGPEQLPIYLPRVHRSQRTVQDLTIWLAEFVAFLLGDPGEAPLEPITLCFSRTRCGRRYVLDPARHLLADKPVLQFRITDLREDTRIGDQLHLRIYADPAPDDLVSFVVVRSQGRLPIWAYTMRRVGLNAWDYRVTYGGAGFPVDGELSIYLFGR